ncbi:spermatogenesis-associated protein 33 [Trichechus inunguis]
MGGSAPPTGGGGGVHEDGGPEISDNSTSYRTEDSAQRVLPGPPFRFRSHGVVTREESGEEQKKGPAYSVSKSKEKAPERPSLEARQADTEPRDSIRRSAETPHLGKGTSRCQWPSASSEVEALVCVLGCFRPYLLLFLLTMQLIPLLCHKTAGVRSTKKMFSTHLLNPDVFTLLEKPEPAKSSKKKIAIPQIIITRPSNETLLSCSSMEIKEQKTIKEHAGWGPLARHRNPSTVDAYSSKDRE